MTGSHSPNRRVRNETPSVTRTVGDTWDSLTWAGALPLARKHWRIGVYETWGSLAESAYYKCARKVAPELRMQDVTRTSRSTRWPPVTVLRNGPSPAVTSSMAIAEYLIERL